MKILFCCANSTLTQRWHTALENADEATTRRDLKIRLEVSGYDLLLLHPSLTGKAEILKLRSARPQTKLLYLTERPSEEEGLYLLRLGIVGYTNSYISTARLREAVQVVGRGGVWISQELMQRLIQQSATRHQEATENQATASETASPLDTLSNREYEVAGLVARGLSNQAIAKELAITERTVKAHLGNIYEKTNIKGRLHLALLIRR
ncbi:MAG: helix-turn-helix transcriptional regulator [Desulfobulbus propionicus]|nr:MAG: helix-turn-helix transcriptional regulator [Desulfobulbus propionicus]